MSQKYPLADSAQPWWKDPTLWVQVVIQTVIFFLFGVGANAEIADGRMLPWGFGLYYAGLAGSYIGLLVQRWRINSGLWLTAAGLALIGASGTFWYVIAYLVVCYEAWYIVAFTQRRTKAWLTLLFVGSFASIAWMGWWQKYVGIFNGTAKDYVAGLVFIVVLVCVSVALAVMIGRQTAHRNEHMQMLAARAELATVSERNRIAREMHDIVAHSLTVVIAQADGGRYAGRTDPEKAIQALDTIAARGRDALSQMRSLLSVLHDGSSEERAVTVTPGVSGIPDLIYDATHSGLRVEYKTEGTPRRLDEVRELTIYRVVQECLTNIMKHAGAVEVTLCLAWEKNQLRIRVDNAPGEESLGGTGHGLTGIAERLRVHGGSASWGPSLLYPQGWNVTAELPLGK
ncbi:sensor histidine kinase [Corynebacterium sp. 4HC-13]|uniref:sensor histidine kinase n=1 Tax=Corynebacterium anserum TaxID=2684406 RepID=UPI00163A13A2|nr:histidine kinase [Corynebacterium anserum]MBC2682118.1 sensor histidine kinase [Corynebacterium anserum]